MKFFTYTIYAKVQPRPLVGDEHFPDGSVGITFQPTPNVSHANLLKLISDLQQVADEMKRK